MGHSGLGGKIGEIVVKRTGKLATNRTNIDNMTGVFVLQSTSMMVDYFIWHTTKIVLLTPLEAAASFVLKARVR